jgi:hypothetical protein
MEGLLGFYSIRNSEIDNYCKDRFIELVPNLNSFGHFERWLGHDKYKHMAECPDGFRRENPFIERDHGTTLKPNQASLDFIDSLYKEYLPIFHRINLMLEWMNPGNLAKAGPRIKLIK